MHVPRFWVQAKSEAETPEGPRTYVIWGWGDDEPGARASAAERLKRLLARLQNEGNDSDDYDYGARPMREEILQAVGEGAVLTRNRQGAVVLNTASMLFLDVDLPARRRGLLGLFGRGADPLEPALERLRAALGRSAPGTTFRIYRTAAGLRVLAADREYEPAGEEAQGLMHATATDPAFARLCRAQRCFRARLTPKPWRTGCPAPPGQHPRVDPVLVRSFAAWTERYARAIEDRATCRHLETVGPGRTAPRLGPLIELHDRATRCSEALPLA